MKSIHTDHAPAAIGPYSQAVVCGNLVFCSGQVPLIPETGELLCDTVGTETERVMQNLGAVLDAAGSSLQRVVKTTIYLTSMDDFAAVNAAYERFFTGIKPARATVAVQALPKGARVEIDCVARVGD